MRSILIPIILALLSLNGAAFSLTPDKLWEISTSELSSRTIRAYDYNSVRVEEVRYQSRPYLDSPASIFGYYVYPKNKKNLPAILLVHGGGGSAHLGRAAIWAARGYAVLAIDLPGKGEQRVSSRSTGPDMDVPNLLRVRPDLAENYLVHAVAAARYGVTYLQNRKEVDPENIGMVGLSWGGVITLLTNGQDKRLKTAVNVFGAGYIPEGCTWQERFNRMNKDELDLWNSYIDPKNFLNSQHAPILFITGTNDHCYYLPTFQKSYQETAAPKDLYLVPNLRHQFLYDTQSVVWRWLDIKLKGNGSFPSIDFRPAFIKGEKLIIPIVVRRGGKTVSADLFYAKGQPSAWTLKKWKGISAYYEDGVHYFGIPLNSISPEILFFISVKDAEHGATSIPVRSLLKVILPNKKTVYAVSSPIERIYVNQMPFEFVGDEVIPRFKRLGYSKEEKAYKLIKYPKLTIISEQAFYGSPSPLFCRRP